MTSWPTTTRSERPSPDTSARATLRNDAQPEPIWIPVRYGAVLLPPLGYRASEPSGLVATMSARPSPVTSPDMTRENCCHALPICTAVEYGAVLLPLLVYN